MGFKEWIIPQDRVFYDLLEQHAKLAVDAVGAFRHMLANWQALDHERDSVKRIESEADAVSHQVFERLNRTFITPIDREDIARLTHALDDVVDAVDAAANRIALIRLPQPTQPMRELAEVLESQVQQVEHAVRALRKPSTMVTVIPSHSIEIHRLENRADDILDAAVADLFAHSDPLHILRHKEVYEFLEAATDRCEDVADVLHDILRKHG